MQYPDNVLLISYAVDCVVIFANVICLATYHAEAHKMIIILTLTTFKLTFLAEWTSWIWLAEHWNKFYFFLIILMNSRSWFHLPFLNWLWSFWKIVASNLANVSFNENHLLSIIPFNSFVDLCFFMWQCNFDKMNFSFVDIG